MHHTPKILIVEDQYFVAIDCEMTLRSAGFECVGLATDAEHAFKLARDTHPDLILMDIRLASRSDGLEAATSIYRQLGIRSIFSSGHADSITRQEAEAAHPVGWLDKPYSGTQLILAVKEGLQRLNREDDAEPRVGNGSVEIH